MLAGPLLSFCLCGNLEATPAPAWSVCDGQVWAGSKQRQLQASSMQLMHQYTPHTVAMMTLLTAVCEPLGLREPSPSTLLGFPYTLECSVVIAVSAALALLVSLSTFLTIGATSAVTFNVVGHIKTFLVRGAQECWDDL